MTGRPKFSDPQAFKLISKVVNIYEYPEKLGEKPSDDIISTKSDLHGNAMNFIHFLVDQQIIQMDEGTYEELDASYGTFVEFGKFVAARNNLMETQEKAIANYNKLLSQYQAVEEEINDYLSLVRDQQNLYELYERLENESKTRELLDEEQKTLAETLAAWQQNTIVMAENYPEEKIKELETQFVEKTELEKKLEHLQPQLLANKAAFKHLENQIAAWFKSNENSPSPIQNALDTFTKSLNQVSVISKRRVRLLGDDFSDRGGSDELTKAVYNFLADNNVPFTVILSNHLMFFFEFFYSKEKSKIVAAFDKEFIISLQTLQELIRYGTVDETKFREFFKEKYLPNLKLIDTDIIDNTIVIYIHGRPGGLKHLEAYAKKFAVPYHDETPEVLAETINQINEKFQIEFVKPGNVPGSYHPEEIKIEGKIDMIKDPVGFGMLNREDSANMEKACPAIHPIYGYNMIWVHGHTIPKKNYPHILGVDSPAGMSSTDPHPVNFLQTKPTMGLTLKDKKENRLLANETRLFPGKFDEELPKPLEIISDVMVEDKTIETTDVTNLRAPDSASPTRKRKQQLMK